MGLVVCLLRMLKIIQEGNAISILAKDRIVFPVQ
jgi:hypothetical protein